MFWPYVTCPGPGSATKLNDIARGPALPAGTSTASALAATTHAKTNRRIPTLIRLPPHSAELLARTAYHDTPDNGVQPACMTRSAPGLRCPLRATWPSG